MRLCMISLDAVAQPDADRLLGLPALSALAEKGVFCDQVKTIYPTLTYPIHTSLITGCYPSIHGIGHNQPFQPDTEPRMRAWYWSVRDIRVKTLYQAAREKGMDCASILWPVSGKNPYVRRNFPEVLPLPGESAVLKMLRYASPLWILRMELKYGKTRKSIKQPDLDDYAALLCEKLYASRRPPDFLTVHLVDCDSMRHWHGTDSPEAHAAMERLDQRVGRIVKAVEKAGLADETLFCVVSDHGQQDAPNGVLLDRELKAACGARAQSLGMGAYIFGDDLSAAQNALTQNQEKWGIRRILDDAQLRALNAPKDVHLAVDALPGHCFIDHPETTHGEHGFSLDCPQARTLLWLSGPGIRRGVRIGETDLINIAPTLARALHLSLPQAQGQAISEAFV
ncbi:MAG: ectonucleotide pyrophosphatase/phosphodiesterase [Clostridia bacterium]|nr:ectonucleotide pyrophosphatase/phosphodiesterase [Clostridia bacterium]